MFCVSVLEFVWILGASFNLLGRGFVLVCFDCLCFFGLFCFVSLDVCVLVLVIIWMIDVHVFGMCLPLLGFDCLLMVRNVLVGFVILFFL